MHKIEFNKKYFYLKEKKISELKKEYYLDNQNESSWKCKIEINYLDNHKISPETLLDMYIKQLKGNVTEKPNIYILKKDDNDKGSETFVISNILIEPIDKNGILEFQVLKIIKENDKMKIYVFSIKANEYVLDEVNYIVENLSKFIKSINDLYVN